jgi:protein-L-isoaspartate(D-aspartate) O-methyltransferase
MDLEQARRFYAAEIRAVAHLRTAALAAAFATVPRERFLGPGPWQIFDPGSGLGGSYWATPDDDPRHVYHNVLVALDPARQLNNGEPAGVGRWLDALGLRPGESVLHLGCGSGYYSAILAETVGAAGRVVAVEVDPELAARSREGLAGRANVEVVHGDGADVPPGAFDAIFVNAGATHPLPAWLDGLRPGGRLVQPLTFGADGVPVGRGFMLRVQREDGGYGARFLSPVGIYHCQGARDPELNRRLQEGYGRGTFLAVRALSRDPHEPGAACWLHGEGFCLQTGTG